MSKQLTLYLHKVQLALIEANAPYRGYPIDLVNRGLPAKGPSIDPEDPSSLSAKITEMNVILEFLVDLYPDSELLPKDPVSCAKVRFFVDVSTKHIKGPLYDFLVKGVITYFKAFLVRVQ
ncbi:uncharacterized protein BJ212DRAFT_1296416 [Suillus subaureus]|uniref:Uncharacterized protein n=1 Tax=Suillus subaureus TaxID=48587 RepID=A0A9P7EK29_9AGAM|nr:uncharacterized protein BJ212DRAFT_1296416 [Suillus subaureus]KAG1823895.1 hypothetical protein BJ212DRAFT_1296416 [Suillus subaureus]